MTFRLTLGRFWNCNGLIISELSQLNDIVGKTNILVIEIDCDNSQYHYAERSKG